MNQDMMKFLGAFLALTLIYFLIGCESVEQKVMKQYRLDNEAFWNYSDTHREVKRMLTQPTTTKPNEQPKKS